MKNCTNYKLHKVNGTPSMPEGVKGLAEKLMKTNLIIITAQINIAKLHFCCSSIEKLCNTKKGFIFFTG